MERTTSLERNAVQRQATAARTPKAAPARTLNRNVLQRRGVPIPAGARAIASAQNSVDGTVAVSKLTSMGRILWRGFEGFQGTPVERQIVNALESGNLSTRSIAINWTDDRGLNKVWTGTVNVRMENPQPLGAGGTGTTTGTGGGSGSSGTSTSSTSTTGGSIGAEGGEKDKYKVSGSGSSSQADTQGEAQSSSGSQTTGATSNDTLQRYTCTIVADIYLKMTMDVSGSDYVNPFKWGMYAAEAMSGPDDMSDSVACGTWTYEVSTGYAPAPAAAH